MKRLLIETSGKISKEEINNRTQEFIGEQENIPVGCVPPACTSYLLDVSVRRVGGVRSGGGGTVLGVQSFGRGMVLGAWSHGMVPGGRSRGMSQGMSRGYGLEEYGPRGYGPTRLWTERHPLVKTLPSRNFVRDR